MYSPSMNPLATQDPSCAGAADGGGDPFRLIAGSLRKLIFKPAISAALTPSEETCPDTSRSGLMTILTRDVGAVPVSNAAYPTVVGVGVLPSSRASAT